MYAFKRDIDFRPVLVVNLGRACKLLKENDLSVIVPHCEYLLKFVTERLMVPGKVENWVTILDFAEVGLMGLPVSKIKALVGDVAERFPAHLFKMYIVNTNWSTRAFLNMCVAFADGFLKAKMIVCDSNLSQTLHKQVSKDCLEQKYGGNCPNLVDTFFPPDMSMPGS
jgi:hypothetical protein